MQAKVEKIGVSPSDPNKASSVELPMQSLPADVIIMGVGVGPATAYLKGSDIKLERDGGVAVDEYLKVKGMEDVYAIGAPFHPSRVMEKHLTMTIGDIAHFPVVAQNTVRRIEHWNVSHEPSIGLHHVTKTSMYRWQVTKDVVLGRPLLVQNRSS